MVEYETAQQIAAQEIRRIQQTSDFWRVYELASLRLADETEVFWVFYRGSRELVKQAHVPGGLFVHVDKQTGHLWTAEEIEAYYEQIAIQRERMAA